ncbi:HAMP domain-containing histidine kinase [Herbaspirillum sp. HC18]|nr:HAMP domain-containing histidine kinase [Herbaspirillum sp. HC18]
MNVDFIESDVDATAKYAMRMSLVQCMNDRASSLLVPSRFPRADLCNKHVCDSFLEDLMGLANFISGNLERIASEWEKSVAVFLPAESAAARPVLLGAAHDILDALAADIESAKTSVDIGSDTAAAAMAALRRTASFDVAQLSAEFLALRRAVLQLWMADLPVAPESVAEMTSFNAAIDRALAASIARHSQRIERARSLFLAMLGHDLRTPLSAIDMACQYLARSDASLDRKADAVTRISRCAGAMNAMIKDMMEFTRSRMGKSIPVTPKPAHLGAICHGVLDDARAAHPKRTFVFEEAGDLSARVDAGRLHQVLWNLLNNAVQNGVRETPVMLTVQGEDDAVQLRVTHRAPAIAPEILATIFDPVAVLAAADADQGPPANLSLGLYIAREIVRAHGGDIDVASSDAETVFTVRLPRAK